MTKLHMLPLHTEFDGYDAKDLAKMFAKRTDVWTKEEQVQMFATFFQQSRALVEDFLKRVGNKEAVLAKAQREDELSFVRTFAENIAEGFMQESHRRLSDGNGRKSFEFGYERFGEIGCEALVRWVQSGTRTHVLDLMEHILDTPDRPKQPDVPLDMKHIRDRAAETRHLLRNLKSSQKVTFSRTEGIVTERIADTGHAPALAKRHQEHNRALEIIAMAHAIRRESDPGPIHAMRKAVAREGVFLKNYTIPMMRDRIEDVSNWLLYHSGLPGVDGKIQWEGDIQIRLPGKKGSPGVLAIPDGSLLPDGKSRFVFYDGEPTSQWLIKGEEQHRIAVVEDITSSKPHQHAGFASAARDAAIRELKERINGERSPEDRIDYIGAEVATIIAVIFEDGQRLSLVTPLTNAISKTVHVASEKYPSIHAWKRRGDLIPVQTEHGICYIVVDWDVFLHDLYE
jgi:hypothetical protein